MRWTTGNRGSIEDMRGGSPVLRAGVPVGVGGVLLLLLGSWLTGTNLFSLLDSSNVVESPPAANRPVETSPAEEKMVDFVGAVADDLQTTWTTVLQQRYQPTKVVLFRDAIDSACGMARSAIGPFYCPADRKVYLDLSFFGDLGRRLGAPGDFAQAYVVAHEVGHHVQSLLGIDARARELQQRARNPNTVSVALELQADCFAGVWGHTAMQPGQSAKGRIELESGDVEEGLNAASAIGDDRLQRMQTGHVMPDSFTHGTSAQRVGWFRKGLDAGRVEACDTFGNALQ
jgi:predicted metalloprotease